MLLPVHLMAPDPDQPRKTPRGGRGKHSSDDLRTLVMRQPLVVRPHPSRPSNGSGPAYMIVVGERLWMAAQREGETDIEGVVRKDVTEQEVRELQLSETYHHEKAPAMELGRSFLRHRDRYGITQQELARRTGITPGTIHHYESLIRNLDPELGKKVDSGELTFKEARSIADIADYARQREIAAPFVSGRLSSVYVERVVGRAKSFPGQSIEELLDAAVNGTRPAAAPVPDPEPRRAEPVEQQPQDIEGVVLQIAGQLDSLPLQTIPEYRRLKLISTLRILDSRVQLVLSFLNGGPPLETAMPRPMAGAAASSHRR